MPLLLAAVVAGLVILGGLPNFLYTFTLRFDLVGLAFCLGFFLALIGLFIMLLLWWSDRRVANARQGIADYEQSTIISHNRL